MKFNIDKYYDWRLRILALANGADIHSINGNLGLVQNGLMNYEWFFNENEMVDAERCLEIVKKAIKSLNENPEAILFQLLGE